MTISSMREFVCFPKAVTEHPRIATAVHTLSLYVSESEESFSWGQSRRSMSELFAAMVHMDCLEELSFIGPFVIPATFPEPLQRMLCKGRAKLPIKTLRLSFTKPSVPRPEYDTTLCLVLLACPRLETLLLCESGNMRMGRPPSYRPLWQRGVQWLQLPPTYATVEVSTARALGNICTLILDMADPEDGPDASCTLTHGGPEDGAAHGRRLEVIWAEQQDIVGMDNLVY
ncbi:uncharacterized protein B0H18DRAFT_1102417 [Fomitopsis serialis]|uniref:uncharacterized protein n=1 Tax=Fomitopsis serialis TaxID=139415 RepID=UPI00200736E8|nr:uncharacterized protein B0H18DRAFT_1102417 [Neoantrodia serialis]KAH9932242.1 hypothetical protein B0H18DRAFT_1102417 [Neoantrodia serialis]